MVESVVGTVVDKAMDAVLRKVSEGKKLSTEDLVILTLGLFRETSRRIDELYEMMSKNYEALSNRIKPLMTHSSIGLTRSRTRCSRKSMS